MRKFLLITTLFVIPCSLVFTWIWNNYPNFFPSIPQSLALRLIELYGAENQEQVADLEIWIGFVVGMVIFWPVGLLTFRKN